MPERSRLFFHFAVHAPAPWEMLSCMSLNTTSAFDCEESSIPSPCVRACYQMLYRWMSFRIFFPLSECQSTISFSHADFFHLSCKLAQHFHRVLHRFSIASVNEFSIATLDDWTLKRWRRKWNFWWRLISVVKLTARKEFILHKLELTTVGDLEREIVLLTCFVLVLLTKLYCLCMIHFTTVMCFSHSSSVVNSVA